MGLFLPHSFLKLLKSKMYLKIMQGSGLWKIVVSRLVYSSFCFLFKVCLILFADAVSGHRWSGTRCLPASVCLGFEIFSGCHTWIHQIFGFIFIRLITDGNDACDIFYFFHTPLPKPSVQPHPPPQSLLSHSRGFLEVWGSINVCACYFSFFFFL